MTMIATPAVAKTPPTNEPYEPTGNMSRVSSPCADVCFDLEERVIQVPTGEWIYYHIGWHEQTEEFFDRWLQNVDILFYRNGVIQPAFEPQVIGDIGDGFVVNYDFLIRPERPNQPSEWTVQAVINENDPPLEGYVIFEFTRTIVWTPRGGFPSADYPCTNGQHPCEDAWSNWN
jgi:hypothetical protein